MNLQERVIIPAHVMARTVGEETVILDVATGTYFGLDTVGARIWELMTEERTLAEICDLMLEEYEVSRDELEGDLKRLAQDLADQGLISSA